MITPPSIRVELPHEVVATYSRVPSADRYWMSKALAKLWPRLWLVPICRALPSRIRPSQV
jgi:hypothetical protein